MRHAPKPKHPLRAVLITSAVITAVSCMDLTSSPATPDEQASASSGVVTSRTMIPTASGRLVINQTQNYKLRVDGAARHATATALSVATADSVFVPLSREDQGHALLDLGNARNKKPLRGRFLRQRVMNGKTYVLSLADTDGYDAKAPTYMLMLTVDGVPALTVLPRYRKSGNRYIPTGGTFNIYNSQGALARSTSFDLNGGSSQTSNSTGPSRLRSVADAVGSFASNAIQPRSLFAQCAFDTGSDLLLDTVLDFAEVDVMGAIAIVNDLFGPVGCSGRLAPVVVSCPACYFVDTGDIWVCDMDGFNCDWQPTYEWYCPPC